MPPPETVHSARVSIAFENKTRFNFPYSANFTENKSSSCSDLRQRLKHSLSVTYFYLPSVLGSPVLCSSSPFCHVCSNKLVQLLPATATVSCSYRRMGMALHFWPWSHPLPGSQWEPPHFKLALSLAKKNNGLVDPFSARKGEGGEKTYPS